MENEQFAYGHMILRDDILCVKYYHGLILDEGVFIHEIQCRKKMVGDKDIFLLLDMSLATDITESALAFAADHPTPENVKAIGVITRPGNDYTRAKLYSVFDKPNIPTRAFLSNRQAEEWFRGLSDSNDKKAA
jgi:hypothetical protein